MLNKQQRAQRAQVKGKTRDELESNRSETSETSRRATQEGTSRRAAQEETSRR
jgi:hypothetical protein